MKGRGYLFDIALFAFKWDKFSTDEERLEEFKKTRGYGLFVDLMQRGETIDRYITEDMRMAKDLLNKLTTT